MEGGSDVGERRGNRGGGDGAEGVDRGLLGPKLRLATSIQLVVQTNRPTWQ